MKRSHTHLLRALVFLVPAMATCHAATMAFTENFDSYTSGNVPTGFSEGSTAGANSASIDISGAGADKGYTFAISGTQTIYSGVQVTNAANTAFSLSVQFTINAANNAASSMNTALVAFASGNNLSTNGYRLGFNNSGGTGGSGTLYLTESGTASDFALSSANGGGVQDSANATIYSTGTLPSAVSAAVYTMTLSGFYTGSVLNLQGSLTNGTSTITVGATDSSPTTGQYFGMRVASNNESNSLTTTFDNFTMVPEPGTAILSLVGALLLLRRERR